MQTLFYLAAIATLTLSLSPHGGDVYGGSGQPPSPKLLGPILFLPSTVFDLSRCELSSWDSSLQSWWWSDRWRLHFQIPAHDNDGGGLYYGGEVFKVGLTSSRSIAARRCSPEFADHHHASSTSDWSWPEPRVMPELMAGRSWIWVPRSMQMGRFWPPIRTQLAMTSTKDVASEMTVDDGHLAGYEFRYDDGGLSYGGGGVTAAGSELLGLGQSLGLQPTCCCGPKIKDERRDGLGPFINEASKEILVVKSLGSCGAHFILLLSQFSIWTGQHLCSAKHPSPSWQGRGKI